MINLIILQETITGIAESQFEKLTNPILGILLLVLGAMLYYLFRQCKSKDDYIKELHASSSSQAIKNVEVLSNLENSIKLDDEAHRVLETLLRENNSYLQTLVRERGN